MENMIPQLINASKKEFREKYRRPEKDKNLQLYIIPMDVRKRVDAWFGIKS